MNRLRLLPFPNQLAKKAELIAMQDVSRWIVGPRNIGVRFRFFSFVATLLLLCNSASAQNCPGMFGGTGSGGLRKITISGSTLSAGAIASSLPRSNGLGLCHDGYLYVVDSNKVYRKNATTGVETLLGTPTRVGSVAQALPTSPQIGTCVDNGTRRELWIVSGSYFYVVDVHDTAALTYNVAPRVGVAENANDIAYDNTRGMLLSIGGGNPGELQEADISSWVYGSSAPVSWTETTIASLPNGGISNLDGLGMGEDGKLYGVRRQEFWVYDFALNQLKKTSTVAGLSNDLTDLAGCDAYLGVCSDTEVGTGGIDDGCDAGQPACDESTNDCVTCTEDADCDSSPSLSMCKTSSHSCVECLSNGDCMGGKICNASNACVPACSDNTSGGTDTGCNSSFPACNVNGFVCTECTVNADCDNSDICDTSDNTCHPPCVDNGAGTPSSPDQGCDANTPQCNDSNSSAPVCVVCEDTQPAGSTDGGCPSATPACDTSGASPVCRECTDDVDCTGHGVCNLALHVCQAECSDSTAGAAVDNGCAEPTSECDDSTPGNEFCVVCQDDIASGFIDGGCSSSLPACDTSGMSPVCVGCLADNDCLSGKSCDLGTKTCVTCADTANGATADAGCSEPTSECAISGLSRSCVTCEDDASAGNVDGGCSAATPTCDTSGSPTCVECLTTADCGGGLLCDTNSRLCVACLDDEATGDQDSGCDSSAPDCETSGASPACVECLDDSECSGQACDLQFHNCVSPSDEDGDGVDSAVDPDDDNDGMLDLDEPGDADNDGIADHVDLDSDNDGIPDLWENGFKNLDIDQDGRLTTAGDPGNVVDGDGDGLLAAFEVNDHNANAKVLINGPQDRDADGTPNSLDLDADGDGICDILETATNAALSSTDANEDCRVDGFADANSNGYDDALESAPVSLVNTDGADRPDYLDSDSDDDSIADNIEAHDDNADGDADVMPSGTDTNHNGIDDAYDSGAGGSVASLPDHDRDGIADWRDDDDDGDGIMTADEAGDANNNGTADYLDGHALGIGGAGGCSANPLDAKRDGAALWLLMIVALVPFTRRTRTRQ